MKKHHFVAATCVATAIFFAFAVRSRACTIGDGLLGTWVAFLLAEALL